MPYVNVRITRDGASAEQKRQVVEQITRTLQTVLGKLPEHTHIVIDEVDPQNWGYAGMLTDAWRALSADSPGSDGTAADQRSPPA